MQLKEQFYSSEKRSKKEGSQLGFPAQRTARWRLLCRRSIASAPEGFCEREGKEEGLCWGKSKLKNENLSWPGWSEDGTTLMTSWDLLSWGRPAREGAVMFGRVVPFHWRKPWRDLRAESPLLAALLAGGEINPSSLKVKQEWNIDLYYWQKHLNFPESVSTLSALPIYLALSCQTNLHLFMKLLGLPTTFWTKFYYLKTIVYLWPFPYCNTFFYSIIISSKKKFIKLNQCSLFLEHKCSIGTLFCLFPCKLPHSHCLPVSFQPHLGFHISCEAFPARIRTPFPYPWSPYILDCIESFSRLLEKNHRGKSLWLPFCFVFWQNFQLFTGNVVGT